VVNEYFNVSKIYFWNYKKNSNLSEELVAERVLFYGDSEDIFRLEKMVDKTIIKKIVEKYSKTNRNKKRINFINKIILDE
jgi:hypothetical protein